METEHKHALHALYVGIDVHAREHRAALIPRTLLEEGTNWRKVKLLTIRNSAAEFERLDNAIRSHVSGVKEVAIAVDFTGGHYSEPLVYFLQTRGYDVYYLETKGVKAARVAFLDEENKSDAIDSASIAYLLYLRDIHGLSFRISATPAELGSKALALKSLVLQRWQLNKLANQATNRLHQLLLAVFPEGELHHFNELVRIARDYPTPKDIVASNGLDGVGGLRPREKAKILNLAANTVGIPGDSYRCLIRELSQYRAHALARRDELTSLLRAQVRAHPYGEILLSFPYLGEIAAATIISIIRDIRRWPDKKKFKKALGVYARTAQSGTSLASGRRGKEGSSHGRRVLFQTCLSCIRGNARDNDFKDYYLRQVSRGKARMKALVSTMGKLAEIIYHCLKTGELYRYQRKYRAGL